MLFFSGRVPTCQSFWIAIITYTSPARRLSTKRLPLVPLNRFETAAHNDSAKPSPVRRLLLELWGPYLHAHLEMNGHDVGLDCRKWGFPSSYRIMSVGLVEDRVGRVS